jgi:hypothetical protein
MHEFPQRAYPRYSRRVQPWRNSGRNVLICPQSLEFMRITTKLTTNWDTKVFDILRKHTRKPLVFRRKVNGKIDSVKPALADAYAVVTHSSTAAIEALIAGVPAFTTGQESAVWDLTAHDLMQIDAPYYPSVEVRQSRIDAIAAHQWTLDEMARGDAWRALHA